MRDLRGAEAHADQFDLRDDEPVAARVFAHVAVDVREAGKVFDPTLAHFVAHAGVPSVKGLDDTDDATATIARERFLEVVLVVGDEVRSVASLVGTHGEVILAVDRGAEGGADFGTIKGRIYILQSGFRGRMQARVGDGWVAQGSSFDLDIEQVVEAGYSHHGFKVEVVPCREIADVPPEVRVLAVAVHDVDTFDEVHGWVWG